MTLVVQPQTLDEALEVIRDLLEVISQQSRRIEEQNLRIEKLEAKLSKNSKNSSKPPSTDQKGNSLKGKNRGGGKPGHEGWFRRVMPEEELTEIKDLRLSNCPDCGGHLKEVGVPVRHQVIDLPETIELERIEYRLSRYKCSHCGKQQRAPLPEEIQGKTVGPRLASFFSYMTAGCNATITNALKVFKCLTNESFSRGTVFSCQQSLSEALLARKYCSSRKAVPETDLISLGT